MKRGVCQVQSCNHSFAKIAVSKEQKKHISKENEKWQSFCCFSSVDGMGLDQVDDGGSKSVPTSAAALLSQGAACNVLYLNTVDMESLTGKIHGSVNASEL